MHGTDRHTTQKRNKSMLITAEILNEMIATKFPSATCTTKKLYAIRDTSKLAKKVRLSRNNILCRKKKEDHLTKVKRLLE